MCKKKMLNGYELFEDYLTELILDDQLYSYLVVLNGYRAKFCSEYAVWSKNGRSDIVWYNPVFGMQQHLAGGNYNNID